MIASKPPSVLSHCIAMRLNSFSLPKKFSIRVAPFVGVLVDVERLCVPFMPRDDDLGLALVQIVDDPVGIKSLVGDQAAEFDVFDQGRYADSIKAMAGEQDEPRQIPERWSARGFWWSSHLSTRRWPDFWSPFCALCVAMNFDDCRIDHSELHVWIIRHGIEYPLKTLAFTRSRYRLNTVFQLPNVGGKSL